MPEFQIGNRVRVRATPRTVDEAGPTDTVSSVVRGADGAVLGYSVRLDSDPANGASRTGGSGARKSRRERGTVGKAPLRTSQIVGMIVCILCGVALMLYGFFGEAWGAPSGGIGKIALVSGGGGLMGAAIAVLVMGEPPKKKSTKKRRRKRIDQDN